MCCYVCRLLEWLLRRLSCESEAAFGAILFSNLGGFDMGTTVMREDDEPRRATVVFKDRKGNVRPMPTPPVWTSGNENVATVVADPDGMSAVVTPRGVGVVTISCDAEDKTTPRLIPIHLEGKVVVDPAEAVGGEIVFEGDEPTPEPEPVPPVEPPASEPPPEAPEAPPAAPETTTGRTASARSSAPPHHGKGKKK